jgi:hypothetical protein
MNDKKVGGATHADHSALFAELRASILAHTQGETKTKLLARLDRLETSANTSSFGSHVADFVEEAEEEAAAIGPFMSRLSSLLP